MQTISNFTLQDAGSTPALIQWTPEELATLLGVTQGAIVVDAARNSTVPVKIAVFESAPPFIADEQQQISKINECDLTVSSGAVTWPVLLTINLLQRA